MCIRDRCETYADGTRGGIIYEWLVEIAKYTGWEYDFIEDSLDQSIKYMDQGKYDLMGAVLKTPGFGEKLYYPEHLMGYSLSLIHILPILLDTGCSGLLRKVLIQ